MNLTNVENILNNEIGSVENLSSLLEITKSELHLRKTVDFTNKLIKLVSQVDFGDFIPNISIDSDSAGNFWFEISFINENNEYPDHHFFDNNSVTLDEISSVIISGNTHLFKEYIVGFNYNDFIQFPLSIDKEQSKIILFENLLNEEQFKKLNKFILSSELDKNDSMKNTKLKI